MWGIDSLDLFLIGTDLNYTNKGSYILPKKLNKKYKFILVLSSAILNTSQNEFMKSIYIPYQFKHHQWASYGNSNAGDYTEAICFYFENDEKLIIPYSLKSGIDQTMIRAIYQF